MQHLAARALVTRGPADPVVRALLAAADAAAARAWEAGHRVADIHPGLGPVPLNGIHVPDDLYTRYMKAHQDHETHKADCTQCTPDAPCSVGRPILERLGRLQDAYLQRQRDQRSRRP